TSIRKSGLASASRLTTNDTAASCAIAGRTARQIGACHDDSGAAGGGIRRTRAWLPGLTRPSTATSATRPSTTSSTTAQPFFADTTTLAGPPAPISVNGGGSA